MDVMGNCTIYSSLFIFSFRYKKEKVRCRKCIKEAVKAFLSNKMQSSAMRDKRNFTAARISYYKSSPALYLAIADWILSTGLSRSLIEVSWFNVSII